MLQFARIFWEICRLKAGPQALPKSSYLLIVIIFAGVIVDSFSSSILIPKLSSFKIIYIVLIYNLVLLISVYYLLKLVGFADRANQTVLAIAGSGFFISLVLLPALLMLNAAAEEVKTFAILILIDNIWRIAVNAHIFRHALSVGLLMAVILSVSYLLFGILVADFLLPTETS